MAFQRILPVFFSMLCMQAPLSGQGWALRFTLVKPGAERYTGKEYPDSLSAVKAVKEYILVLNQEGYLAASADSMYADKRVLTARIHAGARYRWVALEFSDKDQLLLSELHIRPGRYTGRPVRPDEVAGIRENVLKYLENNGYPFAAVRFDPLEIRDSFFYARLQIDRGPLILFDTLVVHGSGVINNNYLYRYLDIRPGAPYSEEKVRAAGQRLKSIPFARVTKPFTVQFTPGKARLDLFLDKQNSSTFNFLIGILPNSTENQGKLLFTGEGLLHLRNPFGGGSSFLAQWKGLRPLSPELTLQASYPYVLGTAFGIDAGISLYKRDTAYLNMEQLIGFSYHFTGISRFTTSLRYLTTNTIHIDTAQIITTHQLPQLLDQKELLLDGQFHWENLDYQYNPLRGFSVDLEAALGNKSIRTNPVITSLNDPVDPAFDFRSLYDSISLKSLSSLVQYDLRGYFNPAGRWVVMLGTMGGIRNSGVLQESDLFRLGGNDLLRGLDDESVLASSYFTGRLELRYILGRNARFSVFADGGLVNKKITSQPAEQYFPFGFGTGLAFETKAGIFAINYALGRLDDQHPVQFRNARIHFGYVNYF